MLKKGGTTAIDVEKSISECTRCNGKDKSCPYYMEGIYGSAQTGKTVSPSKRRGKMSALRDKRD